MKAHSLSIVLFFINFLALGWLCLKEELGVINNAFLKCSTDELCAAQCYPGYVFPDGETQRIYSCQEGVWIPMAYSCERAPVLHVEYSAIWIFNVIPKTCANITLRLNNSKNTLEEVFSKACKDLIKNFTVHFTFETLALTVTTVFSTEYNNYTRRSFNTCTDVLKLGFQNLMIGKVFDNIICENETANYTLNEGLQIRNEYVKCPKGMELKNVLRNETVSDKFEYYCAYQVTNPVTDGSERTTDIPDTTIVTTITDSEKTKDSNGIMRTVDSTTDQVTNEGNGTTLHHTDIPNTTVTMLTNSEKTTHSNEIITVSTTFDKNEDRNASYPVENNYDTVTDRFTTDDNMEVDTISLRTTNRSSVRLTTKKPNYVIHELNNVQTEVYIGASAGGVVFVILVVIIAVVCRKKRSQRFGGHPKALEMNVCSNSDESFKGELIENTLYQSADGFDNKGATINPSISAEDKPYTPLANSTEQFEPDLNNGVEHPSNQTDETKLSNCINKDMNNESNTAPIEDDRMKPIHILNPSDEYAVISKSDKNT